MQVGKVACLNELPFVKQAEPITQSLGFVESVRRNVEHGLPLPVVDRRRAALRVLRAKQIYGLLPC